MTSNFVGPPDDVYYGLGGQIVTYEFDCGFVIDGPGPDFTVYEVDSGSAEFSKLGVLVSADGVNFYSVKPPEFSAVNIPGDETHGSNSFARSYDLSPAGLSVIRFVRLDGTGTGAAGASTGFDLDGIGAINRLGRDCDSSGTLDACETLADCDSDGTADSCYLAAGLDPDCNTNGSIDACDVLGLTSDDCDSDFVPDECEPDCDSNSIADWCDIDTGTSQDCNLNNVPDTCDMAVSSFSGQSGPLAPMGYPIPQSFPIPAAFPSSTGVTVTATVTGDFDATNEYLDVTLNGTTVGRLFDSVTTHCAATVDSLVIPADTFNFTTQGGTATLTFTAPSAVSNSECLEPTLLVTVQYDAIVDCNTTGTLDYCDIDGGASTDLNLNGIADDCEADCNGNLAPDDYDIAQGTSQDCNVNAVPDECDVATATSLDCNFTSFRTNARSTAIPIRFPTNATSPPEPASTATPTRFRTSATWSTAPMGARSPIWSSKTPPAPTIGGSLVRRMTSFTAWAARS